MSGNFLDRLAIPAAAAAETDGAFLHLDVSHLRAFLFAPISRLLRKKSVWVRGSVYAGGIFLTEYLSGMFLKKRGICPWDYSHARLNVNGVIRLDYAPVWFLTGLLYEKLLNKFMAS